MLDDDTLTCVKEIIWGGFTHPKDIASAVEEQTGCDFSEDDDQDSLQSTIDKELEAKAISERSWPPKTDCDRLDKAFATLRKRSLIALHCAGYAQGDALSLVAEEAARQPTIGSEPTGFCFYTAQDVATAIDSGSLYITFGSPTGGDEAAAAVGGLVSACLRDVGLCVEWSGQVSDRLKVTLTWQRRYRRLRR